LGLVFKDCWYTFFRVSVDFTADQPGLTLFHCHIQHHMDYGFKALLKYA
jgi:FtsP/CotA-like multicopper oxidase with cupredoxin domain